MSDDQIRKRICFKDVPISFLYLLKYFVDKYEVRESIFSRFRGSSRNHPKSIAIDQESLISHLGIIITPKKPYNYIKKQWKTNKSCNMFADLGPLFEAKSPLYLSSRALRPCRRPCASGPLQITSFTKFKLLGPQARRVFAWLGPDGSDGQACHVSGGH